MSYGRKNKPLIQIDVSSSGGSNGGTFKGIEILTTDPTGADLYEGRMWIVKSSVTPTNIAPTAPTISLASTGDTTATITLTATSTDAEDGTITTYEIYKDGVLVTTTSLAVNGTYQLTGLNNSTTYSITAKGKDSGGLLSPASNAVSATTTTPADTTAPNNVTNLTTSNVTDTTLTLSWVASTSTDIASYDVYNGSTLLGNTATTTYNVTGLTASTPYTFTVKAKDTSGNVASGVSTTVTTSAIVDTTAPNNVTNLAAGTPTTSSIPITWSLSSSGDVANYEVAYSSNGGSSYTVASNLINASSYSYTITGLTANTAYTVRVVAIDGVGNRSTGVTINASTAAVIDTTPPDQVTNLTAGTITSNSVAFSWAASTSTDIDHYKISYSSDGGNSYTIGPITTNISYTLTGLSPSTTYLIKVTAVDTSGNTSDFVNAPQISATTTALPVTTPTLTTSGKLYDETFANTNNWSTPITSTTYNMNIVSGAMEIYPGTGDNYPVVLNNISDRSDAYVVMKANMKAGNSGQDAYIIPATRVVNSATEWTVGKSRGGGAWGNNDYLSNDTNTGLNEGALSVQSAPIRGLTDTRTVFLLAKGTNGKMKASDNTNISSSSISKAGGNYTGKIGFIMYCTDASHVLTVQKYIAMTDSILQVTGQTSGQYGELLINGTVTATSTADANGNLNFDLFGIDIPKGGLSTVTINIYSDNTKATKVKQSSTINSVYPGSIYSM